MLQDDVDRNPIYVTKFSTHLRLPIWRDILANQSNDQRPEEGEGLALTGALFPGVILP